MDIDDVQPILRPQSPSQKQQKYALQPTNALAGPSTIPEQPPLPSIYLPPPIERPKRRVYFDSTQDLLGRFQLLSAYDRYVRPYSQPVGAAGTTQENTVSMNDKGKGKEKEVPPQDVASPAAAQTPGAGNDGDDEETQGKGDKKWKNNYKHLIKGIPGKHSTKKDDYLMTMMQVPPKQRIAITSFDLKTQRDAFSVSLEGLKQWNINTLVAESPQAREDRKRRKELKKLARVGAIPPGASTSVGPPATPGATALPAAGTSGSAPARSGTPRAGAQQASSRPPPPTQPSQQTASQARGLTPAGVGTPRSIPTPGPPTAAAPSVPASARHTPIPTPAPTPGTGGPAPVAVDPKRGLKREREDSVGHVNGTNHTPTTPGVTVSTNTNGSVKPVMVMNGKPGSGGVRPRPLKKQRMDVQGQAREMPVQQPTPHA